jgi:hypothetical protein
MYPDDNTDLFPHNIIGEHQRNSPEIHAQLGNQPENYQHSVFHNINTISQMV